MANLLAVLRELEFESDLFERRLIGCPERLQAIIDANGGHSSTNCMGLTSFDLIMCEKNIFEFCVTIYRC